MLAQPDRLRRKRDFALLSQKGRVVYAQEFTLRFRPSETTKIGFVASTKVFKRANKRNRVKRRMRAALRDLQTNWPEKLDLMFMIKANVLDVDFAVLKQSILHAFEKIPAALALPPTPRKNIKAKRKTSVVYKKDV
ncbi:MAG: ribonuclease P protein component [Candidatus Magasanikbacteria bacterium]|nr:ribonuclease P protein component [Candidatus Magasanikbacteria bacterium]MCA9390645.1 ribonuclease P protein component [Candidatus Magasanikbacteria bacterium]HPF95188.1 ribonuclease P protein component [bacterium]